MFGIARTGMVKTQRKTTFVGRKKPKLSFKWNKSIHDEHVEFNLIFE